MSKAWPLVALNEVLRKSEESVPIDPNITYREVTIKLWGKGVVLRREASGSEIAAPRRSVVRARQFILSRIDARNGAFGIVPPALDGAVVSNDFPSFNLNNQRIIPEYLGWLSRSADFVDLCKSASEGTTNRVRLKEEKFLATSIALPSLEEQQRIVARIEKLAAKIEEARGLRRQAVEEAEALISSESARIFESLGRNHPVRQFGEYKPHITSGPRNWGKHYQEKGIRFYRAQDIGIDGKIATETKVFVVPPPSEQGRSAILRPGDLMFVITGATVGRCAVYDDSLEPGLVSQHVSICRLPAESILPEYALWGMRSPCGQSQLFGQRYGQGKPGLNLANIRALSLPIPPLPEQRRIVAYMDNLHAKLRSLKRLQSESAAELDAMVPSILDKAFKGDFIRISQVD